jgi:diguanylate cyclase (GGDEF)-like protein
VNDTFGHAAGDLLLRRLAERLLAAVRETDTAARLGGDEFAVVQVGCDEPAVAAATLARRLLDVLGEPVLLEGGREVRAGVSIGVALAPADGEDVDRLLHGADLALYRAKAEGRGVFRLFEPAMDLKVQARRSLERDLRHAVAAGEFEVHYQPQVESAGRGMVGFEALVRWRHPERGLVSPAEFIPLAEETGLIVPLGALGAAAGLRGRGALAGAAARGGEPVAGAVRVPRRPGPDGRGRAARGRPRAGAARAGDHRGRPAHDTDATVATLDALKALGVRVAMDDFGTGYSSLGYLQRFPFDTIKIDQSFVRDLGSRPGAAAIVRAVVGLGRSLGLRTCAEGVRPPSSSPCCGGKAATRCRATTSAAPCRRRRSRASSRPAGTCRGSPRSPREREARAAVPARGGGRCGPVSSWSPPACSSRRCRG